MALQQGRSPLVVVVATNIFLLLSFLGSQQAIAGKTGQLTVFWGRNETEGSLRETCDTGLYTTVIISFFSVFGHGRYWTDISGHDVSAVGTDIQHCQQRSKNVTVLLSIGGDGGQYSLPTARSARDVADHLWHAYLGGHRRGVFRPFGGAVLDGIDFYIGLGAQDRYYGELARSLLAGQKRKNTVRLTASPPCSSVFFFSADGDNEQQQPSALETVAGLVERLHVRFYDDSSCQYDYHETRPFWGAWTQWSYRFPAAARRLHVGLDAAGGVVSGWIDPETLRESVLPSVQDGPNYGGVVLWNRYYDKATGYGRAIRDMV